MSLRLYNAISGRIEEFKPAAPPRLHFSREYPAGHFFEVFESALAYLGCALEAGKPPPELYLGISAPPAGTRHWLKPEARPALQGRAEEFLSLKTHYRKPLNISPRDRQEAQGELSFLVDTARRLQERHGSAAASPTGVAGYKKRFRDALCDDMDFPGALASLWDALRPGALSPGSQLAALREARSVFGRALPFD